MKRWLLLLFVILLGCATRQTKFGAYSPMPTNVTGPTFATNLDNRFNGTSEIDPLLGSTTVFPASGVTAGAYPNPESMTVDATGRITSIPAASVGTTYFIAPAGASPAGNDSNNGTSAATPWLTPNHSLNCGDVILAAAGTYNEANFRIGQWGTVTCAANNNVAWLKCAAFDTCKITISTAGHDALNPSKSYWGVQGWEVTASTPSTNPCFEFFPGAASNIHHLIFANNIANGCGDGGLISGSSSGTAGTDYMAFIGNIAYNGALDNAHCYSGIDVVVPVNSDSNPGTHIFIAGNFSYANVDPNPCQGAAPTDGEGINFDTVHGNSYNGQIYVTNNILAFNGGDGFLAFCNSLGGGSCGPTSGTTAPMYVSNNTLYGNQTGSVNQFPCSELFVDFSWNVVAYNNLIQTSGATACLVGGVAVTYYALGYADTTGNATNVLGNNYLYSAAGNNTSSPPSGYTFAFNLTGTNPSLVNPVNPGAPSCAGFSSVPACMSTMIANYKPTNAKAASFGYQPVGPPVHDPLFPQWLCHVTNLPPGLITMGCI